jgi:polysaccharide pyruvyl transferase WcaK-like protein
MAKLRRCKLLIVGVGAGPIYGAVGRYFVKSALSLADFRSYRDASSKKYLEEIGFHVRDDHIYPDLAFSIPETLIPQRSVKTGRQVVGVGLMANSGRYGTAGPNSRVHLAYLNNLAVFVTWLLAYDYDIRLLIGDVGDLDTVHEFRQMLRDRLPSYDEHRVISEPMSTVEDLLAQIAETDVVIATRFHNVLLSLLCNKPVISISFHPKCASLMKAMDLEAYCLDIRELNVDSLIETFKTLKLDSSKIESRIKDKIREHRERLYEQYEIIAKIINN